MEGMNLLLQILILILQYKDMYFSYNMPPKHWLIALSHVQPKKILFILMTKGKQADWDLVKILY